jgi:ABC-2 type transport system permease protein
VTAILRKELALYFTSWLFYVLATVFLVLAGYLFHGNLRFYLLMSGTNLAQGLWQYEFFDLRQLLLVLVPLLTMRLFAEERKLGTLELLWTYPVRDLSIVLGKFFACLIAVGLMVLVTVTYPLLLATHATVEPGPLVAGYFGLLLLAAAAIACGVFFSALTDSQMVAGATTFGFLLLCWIVTWNEAAVSEGALGTLRQLSLFDRFATFARGGIDTADVCYLLLFTTAFLGFTFFALDARRWRGFRS